MIKAICFKCGYSRDFEDQYRGRTFRCPTCSSPVRIDVSGESAPAIMEETASTSAENGGESAPVQETGSASAPLISPSDPVSSESVVNTAGSEPVSAPVPKLGEKKAPGFIVYGIGGMVAYWIFSSVFGNSNGLIWFFIIGAGIAFFMSKSKKS